VRRCLERAAILASLAALAAIPPTVRAQDRLLQDWTMFHGDARHSGWTGADAPHDSLLAWTRFTGDSIFYSSPVVASDGTIYIGTAGEELLALDPDGEVRWRYRTLGNLKYATPAIGPDGRIYVGDAAGMFYAINPDSTKAWTFQAGGAIKSSATIGPGGEIYFGCDDGLLYALDHDSSLRWTYPAGDTIRSSPAVAPDSTVLFGCYDSYLYALRPDGTLRWRALTGGPIKYASPAVDTANVVYCGSYDGFLYAVTTSQEFLWACPLENAIRSTPAIGPEGRTFVCAGTRLFCLKPDGDIEWHRDTGGVIYSSPLYYSEDQAIVVGSDDGRLHCVHEDGTGDWTFTVGEPIRTSPAPSADSRLIYAADLTGVLRAFGSPVDLGVDEGGGARHVRCVASPNPAFARVTFTILGDVTRQTKIRIHDLSGRRISELIPDGSGIAQWNGRDAAGRSLPAGVYYCRLLDGGAALPLILLD